MFLEGSNISVKEYQKEIIKIKPKSVNLYTTETLKHISHI